MKTIIESLIGEKFGLGTVVEEVKERDSSNKVRWKLLCECGQYYTATRQSLKSKITKNCGCVIRNKLIGKVYGNKTVLRYMGSNNKPRGKGLSSLWECRCVCGETFVTTTSRVQRDVDSNICGCRTRKIEYFTSNNSHLRMDIKSYLSKIKSSNKHNRSHLLVDLNVYQLEDLFNSQKGKCSFTGVDLCFGKKKTASLDRIDSTKDYTIDNVHWVHKVINLIKWIFSKEEFIAWCKLVAEYNKNVPFYEVNDGDAFQRWSNIISENKTRIKDSKERLNVAIIHE